MGIKCVLCRKKRRWSRLMRVGRKALCDECSWGAPLGDDPAMEAWLTRELAESADELMELVLGERPQRPS